jgi:hypothetical protein
MTSLAVSVFLDSELGAVKELPKAGSALEHPVVYDSVAKDLKAMARDGRLEIVHESVTPHYGGEPLIDRLRFRRTR